MKIISPFIDYYDSVSGVMYDNDGILFKRKPESFPLKSNVKVYHYHIRDNFKIGFVGFCGKVYPLLIHEYPISNKPKPTEYNKYLVNESHMFYDVKIADEYFEKYLKKYSNSGMYAYAFSFTYNTIEEYFDDYIKKELNQLFDKYETPIFVVDVGLRNTVIHINAKLKDYNFQTILDPYTAYQELTMWFCNKAINENPPQITDDKILRDQKGFDKWSFKKLPTKENRKK